MTSHHVSASQLPVAALYVRADGPYPARCVEWFDEARDARTYQGNLPIVAHPPCKRWGRFWYAAGDAEPGNDGGLFHHAITELYRCSGVLEHPEASHAWALYGLPRPERGRWTAVQARMWTTCVDQRNYGHDARKRTWLLYVGWSAPFDLDWSEPARPAAYLTPPGRRKGRPTPPLPAGTRRLSPRENELTPEPFADLLIALARHSRAR